MKKKNKNDKSKEEEEEEKGGVRKEKWECVYEAVG
jgi:hypothetical protein